MKNKYIINWELFLKCNLTCSFCSQKNKKQEDKNILNEKEVYKIISNLPLNSHISFLWWETLLFKNIINIFKQLDEKGISYEITTNWTLLNKYFNDLITLKYLTKLNISLDWYWDFHDNSRWKKWLFLEIINIIPKLLKYFQIDISTVISQKIDIKNLIKLHLKLNQIWITEHKLIYLMNFWKNDIEKSIQKINTLMISQPWSSEKNEISLYKKNFLEKYKTLKLLKSGTSITIEPLSLFLKYKTACKQIDKQYRINQSWKLSICEFINNDFWNLIDNAFENEIENNNYKNLKKNISKDFPLEICKTCCKNYTI